MKDNLLTPGHCSESEMPILNKKMFTAYCKFIRPFELCCDIGFTNEKMKFISNYFYLKVDQIDDEDFNKEIFFPRKYETIFCFEVLEHLTNPDLLISGIAKALTDTGTLYLSTPARPKCFYPDFHFNEINADRLQKWLLDKNGLQIVRKKRIRLPALWWFYFTGFRPFIRLFINFTWIYEIKKINENDKRIQS
jgi:SAM-dependent methyltransferase